VFRVQTAQANSSTLRVHPLDETISRRQPATRYGISMSEWISPPALHEVAQKWRALAEQRRAHFVALYHSGRWKRYYSEEKFLERMREAIRACERWAEIAPSPVRAASRQQTRGDAGVNRRTAA
jgi:hypothetical protein